MAASSKCLEHLTREETLNSNQVNFKSMEMAQESFDITLVVKNGKELKAHQDILSEASPYFEKLLNSGMKESREGVICLETYTEDAIKALLEFIYTGNVPTWSHEIAIDLFIIGDYLLLPSLKSHAEKFLLSLETLTTSNCLSTYSFAEKYKLSELKSKTKSFVHANFLMIAKSREFLKLSNTEVELWVSKDEINVNDEGDVFGIILAWISWDYTGRKKYFADLFRQVRLVYMSRDSLYRDVLTNDLVQCSEGCTALVKQAMKRLPCRNNDLFHVRPRRSLEVPVIVVCAEMYVLCYFPRENRWCELASNITTHLRECEMASCGGKLYFFHLIQLARDLYEMSVLRYDSLSNCWDSLPYKEDRYLKQIFARNDREIYALVTEACCECENLSCICCRAIRGEPPNSRRKKLMSHLTKYIPESNSWVDVASFDFGLREGICVVTKGNVIYFIGGGVLMQRMDKSLRDTERYDLATNRWDKVADIQEDRMFACGAACHDKIFVVGGINRQGGMVTKTCEVYDEHTNEWHFIASLISRPAVLSSIVCVDDKLYIVGGCCDLDGNQTGKLQCYDPLVNEWTEDIQIPVGRKGSKNSLRYYSNACSMRVFREFVDNLDNSSTRRHGGLCDKLKCLIM